MGSWGVGCSTGCSRWLHGRVNSQARTRHRRKLIRPCWLRRLRGECGRWQRHSVGGSVLLCVLKRMQAFLDPDRLAETRRQTMQSPHCGSSAEGGAADGSATLLHQELRLSVLWAGGHGAKLLASGLVAAVALAADAVSLFGSCGHARGLRCEAPPWHLRTKHVWTARKHSANSLRFLPRLSQLPRGDQSQPTRIWGQSPPYPALQTRTIVHQFSPANMPRGLSADSCLWNLALSTAAICHTPTTCSTQSKHFLRC
jgi:hypothetical protein